MKIQFKKYINRERLVGIMRYSELAELYDRLEATTKRLKKTLYTSELLKKANEEDLDKIMLLLEGKVYPAWDERETGMAAQQMLKAINTATGIDSKEIQNEWKRTGDLGKVAENLIKGKKQATLHREELEVSKVFNNLRKLADITGQGSVDKKTQLIAELLTSAKPNEAKYIVRTILQQMRVGLGAGVMRDAIAWAYLPKVRGLFPELDAQKGKNTIKIKTADELKSLKDISKYDEIDAEDEKAAREVYNLFAGYVQNAYDLTSDFGEVAKAAKLHGLKGLEGIKLKIGNPIKAMLALKVETAEEGFEKTGKPMQAEYKLDGFRVQIHKKGNEIRVFTRRLENVTEQFPDIAEYAKKYVKGDNFILDAEAAGYDPKNKKYLPFQSISQRIQRKYDIKRMSEEYPVEVNVFDILCYDSKNLINEEFSERRKLIEKIVMPQERKILPAKKLVTGNEEEIEKFFNESKEKGNEGLMFKNMHAPYKPGARVGYMLKYKKTMENLDLVIVKAEWGEGKRSKWLSSYTVACRKGDKLPEVGKVSTGLKEKKEEGLSFDEMTTMLKPLVTEENDKTATVKPKIVIEVAYEEIQRSPTYESGYALRFPRVIRLREDKGIRDISTLKMVEQLYDEQNK